MENHTSVLDRSDAPYEHSLATGCAAALNDADVGSPSLPNYLGATSGGTWGISDDAGPASHPVMVDNLFRQVRSSGRTERSYEESMPASCALQSSGEYAVKHNPAAYFVGDGDRAACSSDDVALGTPGGGPLADAISSGTLPTFALITPNLCDDTHDCAVASGDTWLAQWVPRIVGGADYRAGRTIIIVSWDEPTPMAELVIAPAVRPGSRVTARTDHYGLLRATEEMLGLPYLGKAAAAGDLRRQLGV